MGSHLSWAESVFNCRKGPEGQLVRNTRLLVPRSSCPMPPNEWPPRIPCLEPISQLLLLFQMGLISPPIFIISYLKGVHVTFFVRFRLKCIAYWLGTLHGLRKPCAMSLTHDILLVMRVHEVRHSSRFTLQDKDSKKERPFAQSWILPNLQ